MADEATFEDLVPLRIKHCPGVVLKVIVQDSGPTISQTASASAASAIIGNNCDDSHANPMNLSASHLQPSIDNTLRRDHDVTSEQLELLSISNAVSTISNEHPSGDVQSLMHHYNHLCHDVRPTLAAIQAYQAAATKEAIRIVDVMGEQFGEQRAASEEIVALQTQIKQMQCQLVKKQEEMDRKQNEMDRKQDEIDRKQNEMIQLQRETIDRVSTIQGRIQALLTQTYQLHEYPIPRLFIVLPKATIRRRDRWGKPGTKPFQLFFLCECGAHTQTLGSRIPHNIHPARHEGYDLDRPSEFFEKYGTYILTILQMMKYGAAAATMAVPALANLDLADWLDSVKNILDVPGGGLESLLDSTIAYIQDNQKTRGEDGVMTESGKDRGQQLDKLEVMEGAELRKLEQYLKGKDESRVLGDLYRIVTQEGHVKWVCIDHYRDNYRQSSIWRLEQVVASNEGIFAEQKGKIIINLRSPVLAKEFYDAIIKARGVFDLDVTLKWDATFEDLRDFGNSMTKANIFQLALNGEHMKGPALDIRNRDRRFDPLVQLMCNGRIQYIAFTNFKDFFSRITKSSKAKTSRLRHLSFIRCGYIGRSSLSVVKELLSCCSGLTELSLSRLGSGTTLESLLSDTSEIHETLNRSHLELQDAEFDTTFSQGKIVKLIAALDNMDSVYDTYWANLKTGHITKLQIKDTITEKHQKRLDHLLRLNPGMEEIDFNGDMRCADTLDLVLSTRKTILAPGGSGGCALKKVSFLVSHDTLLKATFPDISDGSSLSIEINMQKLPHPQSNFHRIFLQHGSSIVNLTAPWYLQHPMMVSFEKSTALKGSALRSLKLKTSSMPAGSMEPMRQVIERSSGLEYLSFALDGPMHDQMRSVVPEQYGQRSRTEPVVIDEWPTTFIEEFPSQLPNKHVLQSLATLEISSTNLANNSDKLMDTFVQWIVSMITPIPSHPSLKPSQVSLKDISLVEVHFDHEKWAMIITALELTTLECLNFCKSNFSFQELLLLDECMSAVEEEGAGDGMGPPLKKLNLQDTDVARAGGTKALTIITDELQKRAPELSILGLE
ncbi:hypothetical protein EDD11_007336 [Mortierella claussenii]|nr:hypothetical protein EDD11_007336 [Mortierella claussenii]